MSKASDDVLAERRRQVEVKGWTPEHDDNHGNGVLAQAAMAYCQSSFSPTDEALEDVSFWWPFEQGGFTRKTSRQDLVRAAALIIAEIERIDRHAPSKDSDR